MNVNEALLRDLHPRQVPCDACTDDDLCGPCRDDVARDDALDRARDERR